MEPLIRSALVVDDPVLLSLGKRRQGTHEDTPAAQAGEEFLDGNAPEAAMDEAHADQDEPLCDPAELSRLEMERNRLLEQEREAAMEDARERGYRDGYAAGQAEGERLYSERVARLDALIASAQGAMKNDIEGIEDISVEIVFEAICRILGEAMMQEEAAVRVVKEVISRTKDRQSLVIRISPDDYELLQRHLASFAGLSEGNIDVVADDRVVLGGCLLEAAGGSLDGRLEIQIHQLRETLLGVRARRREMGSGIL